MKYTWLLFDADGTLFDYQKAEASALERAFAAVGEHFNPTYLHIYRQINDHVWQEFERGQITAEQLRIRRFESLFQAIQLPILPHVFSTLYLQHLATGTDLIEGAHEVLSALHRTYQLAIITNGLRDVQRPRLAQSTIGRYFAELIISEEVGAVKPDPAIFAAAFARLGNPQRADVLLIGDSLTSDIQGGQNYGLDTCWFNPTRQPHTPGLTSTYEIQHLAELKQLLL